jgi:hypothetical protein
MQTELVEFKFSPRLADIVGPLGHTRQTVCVAKVIDVKSAIPEQLL